MNSRPGGPFLSASLHVKRTASHTTSYQGVNVVRAELVPDEQSQMHSASNKQDMQDRTCHISMNTAAPKRQFDASTPNSRMGCAGRMVWAVNVATSTKEKGTADIKHQPAACVIRQHLQGAWRRLGSDQAWGGGGNPAMMQVLPPNGVQV